MKKRLRGRPRKSRDGEISRARRVHMSDREWARVVEWARQRAISVSEWLRRRGKAREDPPPTRKVATIVEMREG